MKKILILSGNKSTNSTFEKTEQKNIAITIASFQELNYIVENNKYKLLINHIPIDQFDVVYFRVIGGFREHVAIINYYCQQKNIPVQDPIFSKNKFIQVPIFKGLETLLMADNNIPIPRTGFTTLKFLTDFSNKNFTFPFVIKDTESMQARDVYLAENQEELEKLQKNLKEKAGKKAWHKKYLVQEFIHASHRHRIFVLGNEILAGIIRPMRWRKKFTQKNTPNYTGISKALKPIPQDEIKLSLAATKAVMLGIAGVDLITDDKTGKKYIMEVNYEPQWQALAQDNKIDVEKHILKYLENL